MSDESDALTPLERLESAGMVRPATRTFSPDLIPDVTWPDGVTVEQLLAEDREELDFP